MIGIFFCNTVLGTISNHNFVWPVLQRQTLSDRASPGFPSEKILEAKHYFTVRVLVFLQKKKQKNFKKNLVE